ncbi:MAG: IS5 family transposase [Gemmatimonadetes bacterium]|nr:IS5 family transposase [Gemmatimonadota bacterium]MCH9052318.1 IS5 family transposase [Pseudomonadota bacterium]
MGRSRGGLTTKIHALVDARGLPIRFLLTPGQTHDSKAAAVLLAQLDPDSTVLGDKAYDVNWIRDHIEQCGAKANIPFKKDRKAPGAFDADLYKERNLVERFFNKIRHLRRIATRYEKLAANFLAMIKLPAVRIWLRHNESTT